MTPHDVEEAMSSDTRSIMQCLKEETQTLHTEAERQPFQQALLAGTLPRDTYADSLEQLYLVHRTLEAALRRHAPTVPAIASVVREYQFQEIALRSDLACFGRAVEPVEALPPVRAFLDEIEATSASNPVALLGYHYVLEGSKNGLKFLADRVRKAYQLDGAGTAYLDPYGSEMRSRWAQFRQDMDAVGFAPDESRRIIRAACSAFEHLTAMYRTLGAGVAVAS